MGIRSAFDAALAAGEPLPCVEDLIWQSLGAAARSNKHPWNEGSFSSIEVAETGIPAPRTRTVILRHADREGYSIDFHTDVRSAKIGQLHLGSEGSAVCWLFYRSGTKIQLRLEGTAEVINDERADQAWQRTSLQSRSSYLSLQPPGLASTEVQPPSTDDRMVTPTESERGRANFCVVRTTVQHADWLYLRRRGHVRAQFDYEPHSGVACRWVVP